MESMNALDIMKNRCKKIQEWFKYIPDRDGNQHKVSTDQYVKLFTEASDEIHSRIHPCPNCCMALKTKGSSSIHGSFKCHNIHSISLNPVIFKGMKLQLSWMKLNNFATHIKLLPLLLSDHALTMILLLAGHVLTFFCK